MLQPTNSSSNLTRGEEYWQATQIAIAPLNDNKDLLQALSYLQAFLEEEKITYTPKLDEPVHHIHAHHAHMQGQLDLVKQLQQLVSPQPEDLTEE